MRFCVAKCNLLTTPYTHNLAQAQDMWLSTGWSRFIPLLILENIFILQCIFYNLLFSCSSNTLFTWYFTKTFSGGIIYISLVDTPQNRVCLEDEHAIFAPCISYTWLYRELSIGDLS